MKGQGKNGFPFNLWHGRYKNTTIVNRSKPMYCPLTYKQCTYIKLAAGCRVPIQNIKSAVGCRLPAADLVAGCRFKT